MRFLLFTAGCLLLTFGIFSMALLFAASAVIFGITDAS